MKSNSHFWPAYVDMMTVLLLVYLLITLLFQILMIIAQQNVGIKLRERNQVATQFFVYNEPFYRDELRLEFLRNQNYLTAKNKEELVNWIKLHKDQIEDKGAVIFATSSDDAQMGVSLSLQYDRSLSVFSILQIEGISIQKVKIENSSVNKSDIGFVSIHIRENSTDIKTEPITQRQGQSLNQSRVIGQ